MKAPTLTIRQFYKGMVAGAVLAKCHAEFVKSGVRPDFAAELEKVVDDMMAAEATRIGGTHD